MKPESKQSSASIPPDVREKIIRSDRNEKAIPANKTGAIIGFP
ncbi:hypothetical protein [Cytobacillus firmus]|nr:hypothetical protein [Cytobacillus firmus]MED1908453.1 hypothetical protein [Cytobacillus firmus]